MKFDRSPVTIQVSSQLVATRPASSYLAFAVLARLVVLLLVAAVVFFLADARVDVFFVVDPRVDVLLVLVFAGVPVVGEPAAVEAFFLVVEVRLVVFASVDAASKFASDEGVFLRAARCNVLPSCRGFSSEVCCRAMISV